MRDTSYMLQPDRPVFRCHNFRACLVCIIFVKICQLKRAICVDNIFANWIRHCQNNTFLFGSRVIRWYFPFYVLKRDVWNKYQYDLWAAHIINNSFHYLALAAWSYLTITISWIFAIHFIEWQKINTIAIVRLIFATTISLLLVVGTLSRGTLPLELPETQKKGVIYNQ